MGGLWSTWLRFSAECVSQVGIKARACGKEHNTFNAYRADKKKTKIKPNMILMYLK